MPRSADSGTGYPGSDAEEYRSDSAAGWGSSRSRGAGGARSARSGLSRGSSHGGARERGSPSAGGARSDAVPSPPPPRRRKPQTRAVIDENEVFTIRTDMESGAAQPPAFESHSAVAGDGKIVVFGGSDRMKMSSDVWIFTERTMRWRRARPSGNVPLGRHSHCADIWGGRMYCYGGFGLGGITSKADLEERNQRDIPGGADAQRSALWVSHEDSYRMIKCGLLNTMSCLDLATMQWYDIPCTGNSNYVKDHTSVVYRNRIYYFGGCVIDGRTNKVRVFDCKSLKFLPQSHYNQQLAAPQALDPTGNDDESAMLGQQVPTVRSSHSATVWKGAMYVFGGRLSKITYSNEVFRYRFDTRHWQKVLPVNDADAPAGRCNHAACVASGRLIVHGGVTNAQTVHEAAGGFSERLGTEGVGIDGSLEVDGKVHLSDCYSMTLAQQVWRRVDIAPHPAGSTPLALHTMSLLKYPSARGGVVAVLVGGVAVRLDRNGVGKERLNGDVVFMEVAHVVGGAPQPPPGSPGGTTTSPRRIMGPSGGTSGNGALAHYAGGSNRASTHRALVQHAAGWAGTPTKHEKPFKHYHCTPSPPPAYQPSPPRGVVAMGVSPRRAESRGSNRSRAGGGSGAGTPRKPWALGTAHDCSREFGTSPTCSEPVLAAHYLRDDDIDRLVKRLTDKRPKELAQQALLDQYLRPMIEHEPAKRPLRESVKRLYAEAVTSREAKRKHLERQYLKKQSGIKITEDEAKTLIKRLYKVGDPPHGGSSPRGRRGKSTSPDGRGGDAGGEEKKADGEEGDAPGGDDETESQKARKAAEAEAAEQQQRRRRKEKKKNRRKRSAYSFPFAEDGAGSGTDGLSSYATDDDESEPNPTVQRLFYEGVRTAATAKVELSKKYLPETQPRPLSPADQESLLQRLYYGAAK